MADTLSTKRIPDEWVSVNELTGIAIGAALVIQNQGGTQLIYAASPTKPEPNFRGVIIPTKKDRPLIVDPDESEVWLRAGRSGRTGAANIQEG